jgi:hypothetical protein
MGNEVNNPYPDKIHGFAELKKLMSDVFATQNRYKTTGQIDPNLKMGFQTPGDPNESYDVRMDRDVLARGAEYSSAPAMPLPAWAGQQQGAPASQPARTPHAPPQLALGAPIGAVSPVQVNNQALVNALRAPAAPQAIGGNNG